MSQVLPNIRPSTNRDIRREHGIIIVAMVVYDADKSYFALGNEKCSLVALSFATYKLEQLFIGFPYLQVYCSLLYIPIVRER